MRFVEKRSVLMLRFAVLALSAAALFGCGGSGDGSSATGSSTDTAATSPTFSANSANLSVHPLGEAVGTRTFRSFRNGVNDSYRAVFNFSVSNVGGISTLGTNVSFVDDAGQPITLNPVLNILRAIYESLKLSYAIADDGALWVVGINGADLGANRYAFIPAASLIKPGYSWSYSGTYSEDVDGVVTQRSSTITFTIVSTTAIAPKSNIAGTTLIGVTTSLSATATKPALMTSKWTYIKPGVGKVESTNVDPASSQANASGEFLVPNHS
jgi:hypothetical protein